MDFDTAIKFFEKFLEEMLKVYNGWTEIEEHLTHDEIGITREELNKTVLNAESECESVLLAIEALKEKKEREENNPQTLEQLKDMVGKPVWEENYESYVIIFAIEYRCYNTKTISFVEYVLPSGDKKCCKYDDCIFYKYKPRKKEVE